MPAQLSVPAAGLPPHPPAHLCPLSGTGQETKTELPRLAGKRHRHHGQGLRVRGPLPAPGEGSGFWHPKIAPVLRARRRPRAPRGAPGRAVGAIPAWGGIYPSARGDLQVCRLLRCSRSFPRLVLSSSPSASPCGCPPGLSLTPPPAPRAQEQGGDISPGAAVGAGCRGTVRGLVQPPPAALCLSPSPLRRAPAPRFAQMHPHSPILARGAGTKAVGLHPPSSTNPDGCHPRDRGRGGPVVPRRERRRGHVAVAFPRGFTRRPVWPQHRHRSWSP